MFQFSCRFAFLSTFRLSKRTPKITQLLMLYQANAPTSMRHNFLKHTPKLIIFGTQNLHIFKHNTLINGLLLMQFYLLNISPKLHNRKWQKLRITLPVNMTPFIKEDKILIKSLYEYKGNNARQFITEFPDKDWKVIKWSKPSTPPPWLWD